MSTLPISPSRRKFLQPLIPALCAMIVPSLLPVHAQHNFRIISIGGAITEILFELQQDTQIVGVDTSSSYPPKALTFPQVGYARSLSAEGVLSLAPTHIIATEDAGPAAVIEQLIQANKLAMHILPANHDFEGLINRIRQIATILRIPNQGQPLISKLENQWRTVMQTVQNNVGKSQSKPKVAFILSPNRQQILMGGTHTAANAMIQVAGGKNSFQSFQGFKPISAEALIQNAPEIVIFTQQGWEMIGGEAGVLQLPGLLQTPAGKNRRWIIMDTLYLLGFGPRLPNAVRDLNQQFFQS